MIPPVPSLQAQLLCRLYSSRSSSSERSGITLAAMVQCSMPEPKFAKCTSWLLFNQPPPGPRTPPRDKGLIRPY